MTKCHRCGRATIETIGRSYVFGVVCDRRECKQVRQALSDCDTWHWFKACLPEPNPVAPGGYPGRAGGYSHAGERQTPRGMCEPDLQDKIDMDQRMGKPEGSA